MNVKLQTIIVEIKKYKCHINVEYCASIESMKYIFKYLHKGCDKAFCQIKPMNDEESEQINMKSHNTLMAGM